MVKVAPKNVSSVVAEDCDVKKDDVMEKAAIITEGVRGRQKENRVTMGVICVGDQITVIEITSNDEEGDVSAVRAVSSVTEDKALEQL